MSSSVPPTRSTEPRPCTLADTPARITITASGPADNCPRARATGGTGLAHDVRQAILQPSVSHTQARREVSLPLGSIHGLFYNHRENRSDRKSIEREASSAWLTLDPSYHAPRRKRDPRTGGMMSQGELRIGIVGAGQITRTRHLPGFRRLPGVKVVAVCNRHRESAARVAREFDIPRIYANWEELIDDREIDAVVIGAWPYLHCPVTLAALDAGKHVLTQARMAMNAREAQRMLDKSRECPSSDGDDRPQPLRPDRRSVRAFADRRRLPRRPARGSRSELDQRPGRPGDARWAGGR